MDKLNPRYNTLKIAGSSSGHKLSEETKTKIRIPTEYASSSLKGGGLRLHIQEKSALYGRTHTEETKALMSSNNSNEELASAQHCPLFCKTHSLGAASPPTKELMRQKALGRKHSEETLLKMSTSRGHLVYIHEKCDSEGFKLIGSFVSIRKAAKFLDISANTVRLYINSGEIFKDRYKFTGER
jgi:group I intron endonuclease